MTVFGAWGRREYYSLRWSHHRAHRWVLATAAAGIRAIMKPWHAVLSLVLHDIFWALLTSIV